ncbi:hypothetical protein Moror_13382 [Moniliophthora roreri MCA 2997]|uniref:Uncharacterized protein n=1 Tax=Moniliophthora roreri (strain MCA 2997) TaxID=1381753 RepID=V2WHM0_MONRO|nr:hypothetical protein Moror_13382 [Moniliophthora roreri MCA 2997]
MVSKYMSNLKRQKVEDGERPTSSHAITAKIIQQMWDANRQGDRFKILHFIYVILFLCLLHINKALKIQATDIQLIEKYDEHRDLLVLWLPF